MSFFCKNTNIFKNFKGEIGLSIRCFDFNQKTQILRARIQWPISKSVSVKKAVREPFDK